MACKDSYNTIDVTSVFLRKSLALLAYLYSLYQ